MTPEQIDLVQATFARLRPRADEVAGRFYDRLFALDPSLRSMFARDPADQRDLFFTELARIVDAVADLPTLVTHTRLLGARHRAYGVRAAHYRIVGEALLATLAAELGPDEPDSDTNAEVLDAWRMAYGLVAETMMQGAADAATTA